VSAEELNIKLLPCPFCGSQPKQARPGADNYCYCANELCAFPPFHTRKQEWNTRATPAGGEEVAEMDRAIASLVLELPESVHSDVKAKWLRLRATLHPPYSQDREAR